jgi:hypothetical protein
LDDLDEYLLMLESHRIKVRRCCLIHVHCIYEITSMQLVAKLKTIFDRFDSEGRGELTGDLVEKALVYMNRPVDSADVSASVQRWIDS